MTAINHSFDKKLEYDQLSFLFMPFMYSEDLEEQNLSVNLYKEYNLGDNLKFARHHRDLVKRFGRFPHRNKILDRESSKKENEYLNSKNSFKG